MSTRFISLALVGTIVAGWSSVSHAQHWQSVVHAATESTSWDPFIKSLEPQACGACHPAQFDGWRQSRHAMAFSAGYAVQILDTEKRTDSCHRCHTPLHEQRPYPKKKQNTKNYQSNLRDQGLICAACHVRDGKVYGPPSQTTAPVGEQPHDGFTVQPLFQDAQFCSHCHQFAPGEGLLEGVPIQNTYNEWLESPAAAEGKTCQSCHMPDRQHLWKGIHDPQMTASGLTYNLVYIGKRHARMTLTNTGVGHHFPTYITPRVTMVLEGLNQDDKPIVSSTYVIQRRVTLSVREQKFDTRLAPGQSAVLDLDWWFWQDVQKVRGYVFVEPDEFYRRFFDQYKPKGPLTSPLLEQAKLDTRKYDYKIFEKVLQ